VSEQIEQIAHILHEGGYWKPRGRVEHYARQDIYHLGKSAQQLFDDCAVLHQRVEQFTTWLQSIKERHQMAADMTPQQSSPLDV
jgi:hypothetical protein